MEEEEEEEGAEFSMSSCQNVISCALAAQAGSINGDFGGLETTVAGCGHRPLGAPLAHVWGRLSPGSCCRGADASLGTPESIASAPRQLLSQRPEFVPTAGVQPLRAGSSLRPRQANLCSCIFIIFFLNYYYSSPHLHLVKGRAWKVCAWPSPSPARHRAAHVYQGHFLGFAPRIWASSLCPCLGDVVAGVPAPSPAPFAQLECLVGPRRVQLEPADLGQPFKIAPWHRKKRGGPGLWHRQCWRKRGLAETWALPSSSLRVSKELPVTKARGRGCWKRVPGAGTVPAVLVQQLRGRGACPRGQAGWEAI